MKIHALLCCLILTVACDDTSSNKNKADEICDNLVDDDGDTFVDCDDQDCWPDAACAANNVNNVSNVNNVNNQTCDGTQDVKDFHWLDKRRNLKIYNGTVAGPALPTARRGCADAV